MIGKDMTKMTLPVSFNEPTSLLQRVAEDMEYTDLIDTAAERTDSTERLLYVAAFAASEYASTIGRVAKPFNPLLGETYEYARPDKGYRFFIEQVSHHPPVGAAYAESKKWDYYVSLISFVPNNNTMLTRPRASQRSSPNSTAGPSTSTRWEPGFCASDQPQPVAKKNSIPGRRSPPPSSASSPAIPPWTTTVSWKSGTIPPANYASSTSSPAAGKPRLHSRLAERCSMRRAECAGALAAAGTTRFTRVSRRASKTQTSTRAARNTPSTTTTRPSSCGRHISAPRASRSTLHLSS
jgi:hypothetical protein